MSAIAIIGMACRYAEARSPRELWENVLAQRRSFRRIPRVRLDLADYSQGDDRISSIQAAVLDDYEFDRSRFHVSQDAFLSTDLSHWLALDVAAQALADARLLQAPAQQRERTGVYVGNSLTGEFSRANLLRLRWPYVRRVLAAAFERNGACSPGGIEAMLEQIETLYKAPFPPTNEESLAGGLSNTIAGRICNYFDLKGGGYTVDGACASSLLAIATACSALNSGDIDVAIAGGVDLSLDPFELAGFSSLGALARDKMRVFDAQSAGFWPGEGCGMVALMRHEDALAQQRTLYAVIHGWGISSDGNGGITRPEVAGQSLALRRAYERAGYGIDSVAYFEGHGTGTSIGDAVELQALSQSRRDSGAAAPAALGSIKANIGHTKAAAGVAGLMKAAMALHAGVLPPTTGCDSPHPELASDAPALRVLREPELWPAGAPARAGVSGFGFGGINVHLTLESSAAPARKSFTALESSQAASWQDCELFLFTAESAQELSARISEVLAFAQEISCAELSDLSISLAHQTHKALSARKELLSAGVPACDENAPELWSAGTLACAVNSPATNSQAPIVRAACIASTPSELHDGLMELLACCESGAEQRIDPERGIFFSQSSTAPAKLGFLFPGQASPVYASGGIWPRRFPSLRQLYTRASLPERASVQTEIAQPCIVTASLAGLRVLELFGMHASVAVGHSLGEITALHWAGACGEDDLLRLVHARGRAMAEMAEPSGAMASIRAGYSEVMERLNGDRVVVAARNAPLQTVVSGEAAAVRRFTERLRNSGLSATMLPVSHAFHSPLVSAVADAFSEELSAYAFAALRRRVISTVTGGPLDPAVDLKGLLAGQITRPVQFAEAVQAASAEAGLFLEVGPGAVLSGIARECTGKPVIALDSGSDSLRGLFCALGAAHSLGLDLNLAPLYQGRFGRPVDIKKKHSFLANPCETIAGYVPARRPVPPPSAGAPAAKAPAETGPSGSAQEILLQLVAQRTQLPPEAITPEKRFLRDLHLNSITISQLMLEAGSRLALSAPAAPAEYTNATIAEAAAALELLRSQPAHRPAEKYAAGVDSWVRVLGLELVEKELLEKPLRRAAALSPGHWDILSRAAAPLPERLREEFRSAAGSGLVCCVPSVLDARAAEFLLECAQSALKRSLRQIVFLQNGGGASALARSLFLENPTIKVAVVNAPLDHPDIARWAAAEANANRGFMEAHYDSSGTRREPRLKLLWPQAMDTRENSLSADDLLLVTGGGKGIAAECALQLAKMSGCRLALLGRSEPQSGGELEQNLLRIRQAGVRFSYFAADITDRNAVALTIRQIQAELGPITALLHGAGWNNPARLEEITPEALQQTLAPKLAGLSNVLDHLVPERLRLLVTFGSIIARSGLHGEAHYGLANEWLNLMVERWQKAHPDCRCLNLEWSVWAGIGMGQRLGVLESLLRQGITPLPVDSAIAQLKAMLAWKHAPLSSIITGRFGNLPTLKFDQPELPLLRFLEHTRVHHPGIELITDAELSLDTDPYLAEHAFQGEQLLPAVMGMEAMAQAAMALEQPERQALPCLRDLRFEHPIVIPRDKPVTLRIAALRREPGIVSAVVRCSSTGFQVDHFSGTCVFEKPALASDDAAPRRAATIASLDPARDLYGRILFHQGRFRRVEGYELLHSEKSIARLAAPAEAPWFARHLPPLLVMGDAAARDAALHSIQACIPHKTILPVGVDRITTSAGWTRGPARVHATERVRDGDNFIYDLRMEDAQGHLCEQWEGLHLRAVAAIESKAPWPLALLAPYLERKLAEIFSSCRVKIALARASEAPSEGQSSQMLRELLGPAAALTHRPDGKPEAAGAAAHPYISLSHCGDTTLLACADRKLGCDLEAITSRAPAAWEQLLGAEQFALARQVAAHHAPLDCAATEVWTLKESLRKAGAALTQPLLLSSALPDGWSIFSTSQPARNIRAGAPDCDGGYQAAAFHARLQDDGGSAGADFILGFVLGGAQ
jgi:enediyne polyketide synthase